MGAVQSTASQGVGQVYGLAGNITQTAEDAPSAFSNLISRQTNDISGLLTTQTSNVTGVVNAQAGNLVGLINDTSDDLSNQITSAFQNTQNFTSTQINDLKTTTTNQLSGIQNSITGQFGAVQSQIASTQNDISNQITTAFTNSQNFTASQISALQSQQLALAGFQTSTLLNAIGQDTAIIGSRVDAFDEKLTSKLNQIDTVSNKAFDTVNTGLDQLNQNLGNLTLYTQLAGQRADMLISGLKDELDDTRDTFKSATSGITDNLMWIALIGAGGLVVFLQLDKKGKNN